MSDRYKMLERLGEGGTGSVHKAWDQKLKRFVAVKVLLPAGARQAAGAGENLNTEAAALSALQHPNIVAVYDFDTDGPEPLVVMEFINGETLEVTVRRGALLAADFQQIAAESLEGLSAAHLQGMCHRDLKPSNVMFHWLPDGKWQTKLLDFGLANFGLRPAQQELAGAGTVAGSVHFMAPEQFLHQPLDVRTDLYSMGCVYYYALTGSFPCNGATVEEVMNAHLARQVAPLQQLRPDVSPLLTDWVMWLMSRQPEERPESAAEALRVMRGILSGEMKSLPVQRALKTQPVPNRTVVVAAPLTKDVAARARAADTTATIPAPPPAPKPAPSRHQTGKKPASTAKERPPATSRPATVSKRAAPKTKTPLIAGILAAVIAAGAAAFFLTRKGDKPTDSGGGGVPVETTGGPPEKGLLIWFDAAKGGRKNAGKTPASPGDLIDHWDDRAAMAGNNAAQYHASGSKPEEKARRRPTWMRFTDNEGLKGTHDVIQFDGANCLVFGRDNDKVGDPVAKALSGNQLTWIVVFSAASGSATQGILCAHSGTEVRAWDTFVRDGKIFSGVRKTGGIENHASLPFNPVSGYHIVAVVWEGSHDRLRQWLTGPDGKTAQSIAINGTTDFGDVADVRLGALNALGAPIQDFLKGGIASLLIYNRALDDADRHAAVDYLSRRYFGLPAAKP